MPETSTVKRLILLFFLSGFVACSRIEIEVDAEATADSVVSAGGEQLQGVVLDDDTGLTVFRGIPFAAPPTGDLRWRPPAAHTPRSGVQQADTFAPACPQGQGNHDWYRMVAEALGNPPETIGILDHIDEDCLYLNVWSNNVGNEEKLPVMVWIYGGANVNGYSHEPNYLGHNIASRGVVYVSLNYRVGVMGYFGHAGLSDESEHGASGNYGIQDQIAALKWVQENIAAFGGDPDKVTIFGESAGAANSGTLAASPLATGLFKRVISQSGAYHLGSVLTQRDLEKSGAALARHLGYDESMANDAVVANLRATEWQAMQTAVGDAGVGRFNAAVADGHVLPDLVGRIFQRGEQNAVDLLIGSNQHENFMYLPEDYSNELALATIDDRGGDSAEALKTLLATELNTDPRLATDRLYGAAQFLCPSKYMADAVDRKGGQTYFYHFTRIRPGGEKVLAYHGAEIPYALDTADDWLPADATDAQLTDAMVQYWVNFATTGSPNGEGLPEWPTYTADGGKYMELGDEVREGDDLETELCAILNGLMVERLNSSD